MHSHGKPGKGCKPAAEERTERERDVPERTISCVFLEEKDSASSKEAPTALEKCG